MALLPKRREDGNAPVLSLRDEVNRVFDEFFGRGWLTWPFETTWMPAIDVSETDAAVQLFPPSRDRQQAESRLALRPDHRPDVPWFLDILVSVLPAAALVLLPVDRRGH